MIHALSSTEPSASTSQASTSGAWYLSSSFTSTEAFQTFDTLICPTLSTPSNDPNERSRLYLHKSWSEEVDYDENVENFVGDFGLAITSLGSGLSLQDLTNLDISFLVSSESGTQGVGSEESSYISVSLRTHPGFCKSYFKLICLDLASRTDVTFNARVYLPRLYRDRLFA